MEVNIRRAGLSDSSLISQLSTITFLETFSGTCTDDEIQQFVDNSFNTDMVYKQLQGEFDFILSLLLTKKLLDIYVSKKITLMCP